MSKRFVSSLLALTLIFSMLPVNLHTVFAASDPNTVNVLDYGADPSGKADSTVPVQKALEFIKTEKAAGRLAAATLYFPKGEYHFWWDYALVREIFISNTDGVANNTNDSAAENNPKIRDKRFGILIEGIDGLVVDGGGSLFMNHGPIGMFGILQSKNIELKNFSFDHFSPHMVDLTVTAVDAAARTATVSVPNCYKYDISGADITFKSADVSPVNGKSYWTRNKGQLSNGAVQTFDIKTGKTTRSGNFMLQNISSIVEVSKGVLKFTYNDGATLPSEGSCYQRRRTNPRETSGLLGWESENIMLKDINAHYLYGFGMVYQLCKNLSLDNVDFVAREGTGRTSSSFADHLQISSVGGKVDIRNCTFSNPHDDPINIHGTYLEVKSITRTATSTEMLLQYMHGETAGFPQYYVGDQIDIASKADMSTTPNCLSNITAVVQPGQGGLPLNQTKITVDKELPAQVVVNNFVVENITYTPDVVIKNNRFVEVPTRGILVTTRQPVLIEDNYFDAMGMSSIYISCDANNWRESGPVRDVTIRRNTFDRPSGTAIQFDPTGSPGATPVHSGVIIEDNIFNMVNGSNIVNAKSVGDLTIQNNTINRYNPNVSMTLSSTNTTLAAGATTATTLVKSGNTINGTLYQFNGAKNVSIINNKYDNGFNQRYGGSVDGITITGDDVIASNNQKPEVDNVKYASTDPSVATVADNGTVTAVKAGTTEVYAYAVSGARVFQSNKVTLTVTGGAVTPDPTAPSSITVSSSGSTLASGGTMQFTAAADSGKSNEVTWSVRDAQSPLVPTTAKASITAAGLLTASSGGVVEVIATSTKDTKVYGTKLLVIPKPTEGLSSAFNIVRPDASAYTLNADDSISFKFLSGEIYQENATGKNIFITNLPTGTPADFTATVDLTGKGTQNYQQATLIFYKDDNNYVSVGRHTRDTPNSPKFGTVSEISARATENFNTADATNGAKIKLSITKAGDSYTCKYSTDNGANWTAVGSAITNASLGSDFKIGFFVGGGSADLTSNAKFANLTVNTTNIPFVQNNAPPTITGNVTLSPAPVAGADTAITYTFADTNVSDTENASESVYRWYVSDTQTGVYKIIEGNYAKNANMYNALANKWIKTEVVPVDSKGGIGNVYAAAPVQVTASTTANTNAKLESLSVLNAELSPVFNPNTDTYAVNLPPSMKQVTLNTASEETAAIINVIKVTGTGATATETILKSTDATTKDLTVDIPLVGSSTTLKIKVTAIDTTTVKNYNVTLNHQRSADVIVKTLTAAGVADLTGVTPATVSYSATATTAEKALTLGIEANDTDASIEVVVNNKIIQAYGVASTYNAAIPLVGGPNSIVINIKAADGITHKQYRLTITRTASSVATATDIKIGSATLTGFAPDTFSYTIRNAIALDTAFSATVSDGATMIAVCNNIPIIDKLPAIQTGSNTIVVTVTAEDKTTKNYYTINVLPPDITNANLLSLSASSALSPVFSKDTLSYTANPTASNSITINAETEDATAAIEVKLGAETFTGTGRIAQNVTLAVGENAIAVKVTAKNGTTVKDYVVNVKYLGDVVYLSDLEWVTAKTPYEQALKDKSCKNEALKLNTNATTPTAKTYTKGLGIHGATNGADSGYFVFPIPSGYTRFTSDVGVAFEQMQQTQPNIKFKVSFGTSATAFPTVAKESAEMNGKKADNSYGTFEAIDIAIPEGATHIKLAVVGVRGIDNAHANWCDTMFKKGTPPTPPVDTPITTATVNVTAPVKGATPADATIETPANYTLTSTVWKKGDTVQNAAFEAATIYNVEVKLTAKTGFKFVGTTVAGFSDVTVSPDGSTVTVKKTFTKTMYNAGDMDGNGSIELLDAVLALKMQTTTIPKDPQAGNYTAQSILDNIIKDTPIA